MNKDKIIQITGSGNFSLNTKGNIKPIPLCPKTTTGEHMMNDRNYDTDYETISIHQAKGNFLRQGVTTTKTKITRKYRTECELCEMVDTAIPVKIKEEIETDINDHTYMG